MKKEELERIEKGKALLKKINKAKGLVEAIEENLGQPIIVYTGDLLLNIPDDSNPKIHKFIKKLFQNNVNVLVKEFDAL